MRGSLGQDKRPYLERGTKLTFFLNKKTHLPLAVRGSTRGELAGRLGTHDGNDEEEEWE